MVCDGVRHPSDRAADQVSGKSSERVGVLRFVPDDKRVFQGEK
jgi:hypothetical protein